MVSLVPMASATLTVSQVVVALEFRSVLVVAVPVTAIAVVLAATTTPATKPATSEDVRAMGLGSLSHGGAGSGPRRTPTGAGIPHGKRGWFPAGPKGGGGLPGNRRVVLVSPVCQEVTVNPLKTASMFSPG